MEKNIKYSCSLTGNLYCIKEMLLFREMNNFLVCDVNAKVNEKGIWCNPNRKEIEKAIEKQVFDELLNKKLKIPGFFLESIENNLKLKVLNLIGLARKAGLLEIGYEKVSHALKKNAVDVVIIAKGAEIRNSLFEEKDDKYKILLNKYFTSEEIGKAIGYKKVLCVALIVSKLSNTLKLDFYRLGKFKLN
jgi:ribosomal protein L7Ae-like RNA K-turn-binding protein